MKGLGVERDSNHFMLPNVSSLLKSNIDPDYSLLIAWIVMRQLWLIRLEDKRVKMQYPAPLITGGVTCPSGKQWIDWMAVLTVIRRRGSLLLTKTALTCASASGCVETACACCTIHSCHFAVTDGDLVRVGFIAVRRKANYMSHYNLFTAGLKTCKIETWAWVITGDAFETDPNTRR